jgi:hypothetical protein
VLGQGYSIAMCKVDYVDGTAVKGAPRTESPCKLNAYRQGTYNRHLPPALPHPPPLHFSPSHLKTPHPTGIFSLSIVCLQSSPGKRMSAKLLYNVHKFSDLLD